MNEIILLKLGELALKGLNRGTFEAVLMKNIRRACKPRAASASRRPSPP